MEGTSQRGGRELVQRREILTQERHVLKVEDSGDRYRKQVKHLIRLQGKWLLRTGISPEDRVEIVNPRPGILVLRVLQAQE